MTNLVVGSLYQHAHADQAWSFELEGERTFPFVATHGFGVHPLEMWLLPKSARGKQEYGMLHQIPRTALLLMRGDFVHAGGVQWHPRCHMKFFPRVEAGLVKKHADHYWLLPNFKKDLSPDTNKSSTEHVFLWLQYNFPFAFPCTERKFDVKAGVIEELVTYPPDLTKAMMNGKK